MLSSVGGEPDPAVDNRRRCKLPFYPA